MTTTTHEYFSGEFLKQIAEENGYLEGVELSNAASESKELAAGDVNGRWKDGSERGSSTVRFEWRPVRDVAETERRSIGSYCKRDRVLFVSTSSDIGSAEELHGRSIGSDDGTVPFHSTAELLERSGLDETAVDTERIETIEERLKAVKTGSVDAIVVREPYATLGRYDAELDAVWTDSRRVALVVSPAVESERANAFRTALNRAIKEIEDDRDRYRERYVDLLEDSVPGGDFEGVDFDRLRDDIELRTHLPIRGPDTTRLGPTEWMAGEGYVEDGEGIATLSEGRTPY
ncbi:ABC-type nitrate/sulfonate/bicarbonate transport system, periplasmic component (plasmid) [Natronococcus occultus SP4]|uniref:ABC-type nitrate/sulfonate/bicarbonate transport system, periplasmic component n=2 Tax=Natronococcus occultus TaxID=29288 RepID=L0K3T1_9EURY|nr:ABC-type nitrate/sulfonate/bicarbonate transport system, periplasmic component [Natronococcus occultus SP4]